MSTSQSPEGGKGTGSGTHSSLTDHVVEDGQKQETGCAECDTDKPKHIKPSLWEKFKALEKRTDEVTRRSTEKRMKHLRSQIMETVQEHLDPNLDSEGSVLGAEQKVKSAASEDSPSRKKQKKEETANEANLKGKDISQAEQWKDVQKYLDINKHLEAQSSSGDTHLDRQIEAAINKGDYSTADRLSDQLANRQFGTKIAQAFDARDFLKRKKEEESKTLAKKKKKLNWGFEHKERWESKSNM